MNLIFRKYNSQNLDFIALVKKLDKELAIRDGRDHKFYNQFNSIDNINHVLVAYLSDKPVACGAIKPYKDGVVEVKRMYALKEYRGQGIATQLLRQLESLSVELGYTKMILETGIRYPEAIALYEKNGFSKIQNYDQYADMQSSVCFAKKIT